MILKFKDNNNSWNWIDEIRHFKNLSFLDNKKVNYSIGFDDDNEENSFPVYLELTFQNGEISVYEMNVKEIYLCNDSNGSTIDVIKSLSQ